MPYLQTSLGRVAAAAAAIAANRLFCEAFVPSSPKTANKNVPLRNRFPSSPSSSATTTRLYDMSEWRDQNLLASCEAAGTGNDVILQGGSHPSEVAILPFPYTDVLLQGETVDLHLYEDRFVTLFRDVVENHCGVVGMGLLAGAGLITTVPLCQVEAYNDMSNGVGQEVGGGLGVFVTLRMVGRANIVGQLTQEEPYLKGRVVEIEDEIPKFLEVPSIVAGNIENFVTSISSLEHDLRVLEESGGGVVTNGPKGNGDGMNRRLVNAQLESLFMDNGDEEGLQTTEDDSTDDLDDDDDDDDDENDDDKDEENLDCAAQFQKAYKNAITTDTQGYVVSQAPSTSIDEGIIGNNKKHADLRSAEDLVAISWAAFCTGKYNNSHKGAGGFRLDDDAAMQRDVQRIEALDCTNLLKRLKLASAALMAQKVLLKAKVALAKGNTTAGEEDGESDSSERRRRKEDEENGDGS